MATYQNYSGEGFSAHGGSITITHPSGLAVGNLMVAHIVCVDPTGVIDLDTPSGWTQSASGGSNNLDNYVYWKIATAGDVSAGSTTWSDTELGGAGRWSGGAIHRITGTSSTPITISSDTDNGNANPAFDLALSPPAGVTDYLLLWLMSAGGNVATSDVTNYACTGSPTWTERLDTFAVNTDDINYDMLICAATATYSSATQIIAASCSVTNGTSMGESLHLICITPEVSTTVADAGVQTVTSSVQDPTFTAEATVADAGVQSVASAVQAPTITTPASTWVNTSKSSAPNWVNTPRT